MSDRENERPRDSWQILLVAAVLVASGVWFWAATRFHPDVAFLGGPGTADWIEYPLPRYQSARPATLELRGDFSRTFEIGRVPDRAPLRIRAFRRFSLQINAVLVPLPEDDRNWKQVREIEVAQYLRPGRNNLQVSVFNPRGPPALWLVLTTGEKSILSDAQWTASLLGSVERAARKVGEVTPVSVAVDAESLTPRGSSEPFAVHIV